MFLFAWGTFPSFGLHPFYHSDLKRLAEHSCPFPTLTFPTTPLASWQHLTYLDLIKNQYMDFPGGPVAKTLRSQGRFDSWSGN